jgi:hypothetical protein
VWFFEVIHMRKYLSVLATAAFLLASFNQAFAVIVRGAASSSTHPTTGPWAVACGAGAFTSLAIGSAIKANEGRQLTVTEAAWHAAICPVFLPIALISTVACTDNKATLQVARLAFLFVQKHPGADQSAFTNAYVEACQGSLSRATLRTLRGLAR